SALHTAQSRRQDGQAALETQQRAAAEAAEAWQNALGDHGFSDEASYEKAVMPDSAMKASKAKIDQYDRQRLSVEAAVQSLTELWADKQTIDVTVLTEQKAEIDQKLKVSDAAQRRISAVLTQNQRILPRLKASAQRLKALAEDAEQTADLYRTASGSITGAQKLPFENYILQYYFRRVLVEANRRLATMSDGRYSLCQKQEEAGKAKSGLLLDVLDRHTGKSRDVSTLSGGESFLASLALALGFADAVQARQGGVRLDTLFIDEGFGTLDEEALSRAMDVLRNLAGGSRLIGVISHVTGLKDAIDQKLLVRRDALGASHILISASE
ncbi:MAG: SbcC/MukB-like Walker B domain-containing protein, partial [Eubacteriales bacterium]|nr:SbcC/MukB-like Walker B domain-containing protein [Eubacteriales bacterium]